MPLKLQRENRYFTHAALTNYALKVCWIFKIIIKSFWRILAILFSCNLAWNKACLNKKKISSQRTAETWCGVVDSIKELCVCVSGRDKKRKEAMWKKVQTVKCVGYKWSCWNVDGKTSVLRLTSSKKLVLSLIRSQASDLNKKKSVACRYKFLTAWNSLVMFDVRTDMRILIMLYCILTK